MKWDGNGVLQAYLVTSMVSTQVSGWCQICCMFGPVGDHDPGLSLSGLRTVTYCVNFERNSTSEAPADQHHFLQHCDECSHQSWHLEERQLGFLAGMLVMSEVCFMSVVHDETAA